MFCVSTLHALNQCDEIIKTATFSRFITKYLQKLPEHHGIIRVFRWTGDADYHGSGCGEGRRQRDTTLQRIIKPSQRLQMVLQWLSSGQYVWVCHTPSYQRHEWDVHLHGLQQHHGQKQHGVHHAYRCWWDLDGYFMFVWKCFSFVQTGDVDQERTKITVVDFCFVFRSNNWCTSRSTNESCHSRSYLWANVQCDWTSWACLLDEKWWATA